MAITFVSKNPKTLVVGVCQKYQEIHWFQVPLYNKNLKWNKETIEEKTIDKQGNIQYDEKRFNSMFKDEYKPTSPEYEKRCEILGENNTYELY